MTAERELQASFDQLIMEQEYEILQNNGEPLNPGVDPRASENSQLVRNRVPRKKDANRGIEDIVEEMPSRTIGRKHGRHIAHHLNQTTFPRHSVHRNRGIRSNGSLFRHHRMMSADGSHEEVDAIDIYDELAAEDGDIDNDELRELPLNMTLKRQVRDQAVQHRERAKAQKIGCFSLLRYNTSLKWTHFWDDVRRSLSSAELWGHHLKEVEGQFGTGVLSYFKFLRSIFFLSFFLFLLNFSFVVIPQVLDPPPRTNPDVTFTGEELLTGANWLTETIMYYGYYTNGTIERIPGVQYDMPLAYLLTIFGYFIVCLISIVILTAKSFRKSYIDGKEHQSHFISKVFCNWDFGITSENIARLHHKTIATELKEILAERRRLEDSRTFCEKLEVVMMRLFSWLVYFAIVGGCLYLVYFVNQKLRNFDNLIGNDLLNQMSLAMVVSAINLLVPYIITIITHMERYRSPRHELYINIMRNFLLKMGLIAIICAYWTADSLEEFTRGPSNSSIICWETELGQEIYRLMVVDFIFSILFATFCAEFIRNLMATYCCTALKKPEFEISNNVLDLIYGQTLCWVGVYFSPLLGLINIIKYFLLFYIKKISVMYNCAPSSRRWRAAQSQTIFQALQLLSFVLASVFLCYVVFLEAPSPSCGPFREYNKTYDVMIENVSNLSQRYGIAWISTVLNIVSSVWFLYGIVITLYVFVYFARTTAHGHKLLEMKLRTQISLEGKDKALLLKWLQDVAKSNKIPRNEPRSHTGSVHHTPILTRKLDSARQSMISRNSSGLEGTPSAGRRRVFTTATPQVHKDPLLLKAQKERQRANDERIAMDTYDVVDAPNIQGDTSSMNGLSESRPYMEGSF